MSKVFDFLWKIIEGIFVSVISAYILFFFLGGQVTSLLESYFPALPLLLTASLILAIVGTLLYRLYKSVRYRRGLERRTYNVYTFLKDWDALNDSFHKAMETNSNENYKEFESIRTRLLYNYPRISSMTGSIRCEYVFSIWSILG